MADTISDTLQSIDTTLRHIERMLVRNVCGFEPKIENLELSDPMAAEKLLWAFEKDEKTGNVTIVPMNGDRVVIHGKNEAEMFYVFLLDISDNGYGLLLFKAMISYRGALIHFTNISMTT